MMHATRALGFMVKTETRDLGYKTTLCMLKRACNNQSKCKQGKSVHIHPRHKGTSVELLDQVKKHDYYGFVERPSLFQAPNILKPARYVHATNFQHEADKSTHTEPLLYE
jgi:hypothetical protein